jgi:drug/metabolite transporter (DMT)-like permease
MRTHRLAVGAGAGAALSWGLAPTLAKWLALDGLSLAFYRMWLGAAVTMVLLYLRGGRLTRECVLASVPGGSALVSDASLFFTAVQLTTVSNATVICSLIPVPILLVTPRMFGERVKLHDLGWVAAALGGVSLVVYGSSGTLNWSPKGDLLAVGSMLSFAAYFIASKRARQSMGTLEYQSAMMLVGAIAVTPAALIFGTGLAMNSAGVALGVGLLALVPSIGHLLMNWAHPHLELWVAATLTSTMPVVAALLALAVFKEPIVPWQMAGMLVVVVAVVKIAMRTDQMKIGLTGHPS